MVEMAQDFNLSKSLFFKIKKIYLLLECIKLNCGQRCVGEGVNSTYTCACNEGFELDPDGRTCNGECFNDYKKNLV